MSYPLSARERRFIRKEVLKAIVQGSIPPAIVMWFAFTKFPMPLWGSQGFAEFLLKNSFGMGAIMSLLMTLGVRGGVRKGQAPALGWTRADQPLLRLVPRNVIIRAVAYGLCTMTVVGSLSIVVAAVLRIETINHLPFVLYMACQCAMNAVTLSPFILIGAMSDPGKPKPSLA